MSQSSSIAQILNVLDCILKRDNAPEEETVFFQSIKHDKLVNDLERCLSQNRHWLEHCQIEVSQALNDRGVDLLMSTDRWRIGFQIKSQFDVKDGSFSANVKRQLAESLSHDLDRYYIIICAEMKRVGERDVRMAVTHLMNDLRLMTRNKRIDVVVLGPAQALHIWTDPICVTADMLRARRPITTTELTNENPVVNDVADTGYENLPLDETAEIMQAVSRYDAINGDSDEAPDSDEWLRAYHELQSAYDKQAAKQFVEIVLPSLPAPIRDQRIALIASIKATLEECRNCSSWDRRSEYKLPQWLNQVPEHMIPYTSVLNLLKIEKNVVDYLRVHREMANEGNQTGT